MPNSVFFIASFSWWEYILGEQQMQMGRIATRNRVEKTSALTSGAGETLILSCKTAVRTSESGWRSLSGCRRWEVENFFALELFRSGVIFVSCRYTNFTAKNAGRTARFWFVRAIGRAPNALNAARRSSKRNSPLLPQRTPAALLRLRRNAAVADAARDAVVIEVR